ncbi:hypothetical protein LINGRAHAP2_LOCUS18896 [Linum grandiflorum]
MTDGGRNKFLFIPEDLIRDILSRLPTSSTAARFRSVSKSWENLLSDSIFNFQRTTEIQPHVVSIRKKRRKKRGKKRGKNKKTNQDSSFKILITGFGENYKSTVDHVDNIPYSLLSYETLREETSGEIPLADRTPTWDDYVLVGCCDGIFCFSRMNFVLVSEILLWNPATSETMFLPLLPFRNPRTPTHILAVSMEIIGFGFDPQTNDYKVVEKVQFVNGDADDHPDPDEVLYEGPLVHAEVYSLKRGSWKTIRLKADTKIFGDWLDSEGLKYLNQQREVSRNDKCYWFYGKMSEQIDFCGILSFDVRKEVFDYIEFSPPPVSKCLENEDERWTYNSSFMVKGTVIVTFRHLTWVRGTENGKCTYEMWGLSKFGVAEYWTKLSVIEGCGPTFKTLEVWKDNAYICSFEKNRDVDSFDREKAKEEDAIIAFDVVTKEPAHNHRLEIEGTIPRFGAHVFKPTKVSLSRQIGTEIW